MGVGCGLDEGWMKFSSSVGSRSAKAPETSDVRGHIHLGCVALRKKEVWEGFGGFIWLIIEGGMVLGGSRKVSHAMSIHGVIGYSDIRLSKFRHRT